MNIFGQEFDSPQLHQVDFIEYLFVSILFLFFNNGFNFHQSPTPLLETQDITTNYESLVQILKICTIFIRSIQKIISI